MTKHTVASLHAQVEALTSRVIALEAALAARSTQPAAPRATSDASRTKHCVQIARNDEGGWSVWLDYKLHSSYSTFRAGHEAGSQLKLSLESAAQ